MSHKYVPADLACDILAHRNGGEPVMARLIPPSSDGPTTTGHVATSAASLSRTSGLPALSHQTTTATDLASDLHHKRPAGWRNATIRRRLGALRDAIAAKLKEWFGTVELTIGDYCDICQDVHEEGVKCPRAMMGRCLDCNRWRALDRFGNCAKFGHTSIVRRRLRWPNAYKQARIGDPQ